MNQRQLTLIITDIRIDNDVPYDQEQIARHVAKKYAQSCIDQWNDGLSGNDTNMMQKVLLSVTRPSDNAHNIKKIDQLNQ